MNGSNGERERRGIEKRENEREREREGVMEWRE